MHVAEPTAVGVKTPADVIVPFVAVQVTAELKAPVPWTFAAQVAVCAVVIDAGEAVTVTEVIVGLLFPPPVPPPAEPPQPLSPARTEERRAIFRTPTFNVFMVFHTSVSYVPGEGHHSNARFRSQCKNFLRRL